MSDSERGSGFDLSRTIRRIVVLGFALIQLVLVCRILLDFGVIPPDSFAGDPIVRASNALAAPVRGVGGSLGSFLGGTGASLGGVNMAMVVALAGWTVVETLVMRVVRKFDEI
jgi:hypothetical protein